MFKFGFGAILGFAGGLVFFSKGLMGIVERDGDLSKIEEIVNRNIEKRAEMPKVDLEEEIKKMLGHR